MRTRLLLRLEHDGAGPVAEQHAGGAVVPVEDARKRLGADHQRALVACRRASKPSARRQRIDEAGADRLQIEGGAVGDAETGLHRHRGRREGVVGRRGRQHDQIDRSAASTPASASAARAACIARSEVISPSRGDMALADAGALHNPFVGGIDHARQFGVGDDARGQIAARSRARPNATSSRCLLRSPAAARHRLCLRSARQRLCRSWPAIRSAPCRSQCRSPRRNLRHRRRRGF